MKIIFLLFQNMLTRHFRAFSRDGFQYTLCYGGANSLLSIFTIRLICLFQHSLCPLQYMNESLFMKIKLCTLNVTDDPNQQSGTEGSNMGKHSIKPLKQPIRRRASFSRLRSVACLSLLDHNFRLPPFLLFDSLFF